MESMNNTSQQQWMQVPKLRVKHGINEQYKPAAAVNASSKTEGETCVAIAVATNLPVWLTLYWMDKSHENHVTENSSPPPPPQWTGYGPVMDRCLDFSDRDRAQLSTKKRYNELNGTPGAPHYLHMWASAVEHAYKNAPFWWIGPSR
jgi:hypothetical protein